MCRAPSWDLNGVRFFKAVFERDCEGIIAKHRLAPYVTSPATWFKVLNSDYTQNRGRKDVRNNSESPASPLVHL